MKPRAWTAVWALLCWAGTASAGEGDIVLLLTHPQASELRNIEHLVEQGLFKPEGLRLVGIHHQEELDDYDGARRYLEEDAPGWMELREVACDLPADEVFAENDCTPEFRDLFEHSAGVLFTGGPDLPPSLYGEKTLLTTDIQDPPRHRFELSLLFHLLGSRRNPEHEPWLAERTSYTVLGICLGMQSINVATGGTMIQDIPSEVYGVDTCEDAQKLPPARTHRSYIAPLVPGHDVGWAVVHPIKLVGRSRFRRALLPAGGLVRVVSVHHQAVEKLGRGLEVIATSPDGKIVEGLRHKRFPNVLGVQFHPEKTLLWDTDRIYLAHPGADQPNHIAHWYNKDKKAQALHRAYWRLVGQMLTRSARTRPAAGESK